MLADSGANGVSRHSKYVTDRARMRRWLSAADAYLITSRTEGMPDARAAGSDGLRAAGRVQARSGPARHLRGQGGLSGILVDCDDAEGAALALERLAASAGRREALGRAARTRVEARFSTFAVGRALAGFMRPSTAEARRPVEP